MNLRLLLSGLASTGAIETNQTMHQSQSMKYKEKGKIFIQVMLMARDSVSENVITFDNYHLKNDQTP